MNIMYRLERKLPFLSKLNLIYPLMGCYALGYVLQMVAPSFLQYLAFDPELIFRGQVWRLITFVIINNSSSNFFMALIMCFIYISIAKSLEQIVGTFRLNFFMVSGLLIEILMGFLFYVVFPKPTCYYVQFLNPYYLYAMMFVLFAILFPEARFLFMFIFPIKGKWMIFITMAMYLLEIINAFVQGFSGYAWIMVFMIIGAVLTLILFLFLSAYTFRKKKKSAVNFKKASRAYASGRANVHTASSSPRHKCEICGRTNISNPELDFRYCSKCFGAHEYCQDHIYTHIHIKDPSKIAGNYSDGNRPL